MHRFIMSLKDARTGSFRMHDDGETDMRACYLALAVAHMTRITTPDMLEGVPDYIARCKI